MKYNFKSIEKKFQKKWAENHVYEPSFASKRGVKSRPPFYNLMMFPYPSAEGLHVGNMYAFTGSDIYGRFKRMEGHDVFEPIGLDGFGIHSENYALKIGKHPAVQAKISQKNFYRQLTEIGNGFSWNEKLETYDPDYYRWTQWIFVQMFRRGLAYRKKQKVNWCPSCKTVLADEQVIRTNKNLLTGVCERCDTQVEGRELEQWFFKITEYAEKLLRGLDKLDWSEKIKLSQKHWIGRSEGSSIKFKVTGGDTRGSETFPLKEIEVFTTRPETIFGVTFIVVSPELALRWTRDGWNASEAVSVYIKEREMVNEKRKEEGEKTGVFSDIFVENPATNQKIPVWISDYVLGEYGTGAIMAVPAHDSRDLGFANQYDLPVRQVIARRDSLTKSRIFGMEEIEDGDLIDLEITISRDPSNGERKIIIPHERIHAYESLVIKKLDPGFWIEYVGPETVFIFKHKDGVVERIELDHRTEAKIIRLIREFSGNSGLESVWRWLVSSEWYADIIIHSDSGILINSGKFTGSDSDLVKWNITEFTSGTRQTRYRLRDWLISRQRYWGPPIPMIYCESCAKKKIGEREDMPGWYAVSEDDLPVELPRVKDFRPQGTGESPLASAVSWMRVSCLRCGSEARGGAGGCDTVLD